MNDFIVALGLVFVIEGLAYALFPGFLRRMSAALFQQSDEGIRLTGVLAALFGIFIVWLIRG